MKESTKEELEKMIKLVGRKLRLSDSSAIHYIGGDFFLITSRGEIKILLEFELIWQGKKRWVEVKRFMLVDEGIDKDRWVQANSNFKKVGEYYEIKN